MKLENGYKLIYEVIEDGVREFRASTTGVPTDDDFVLTSNKIGENKLVYQYKNKFYGTGDKLIPTYNEDGTPADTALISDEAFAEVFVAKKPDNEPVVTNEVNNETPVEGKEPNAGEEKPAEEPKE
jgi:hypothetical protein